MRLNEVVQVDNRFQKSVNLFLDMDSEEKLISYIPTRSSLHVLDQYISNIDKLTGNRATILIGPYGKGKSHLVLLLLNLFRMNKLKGIDAVLHTMASVDKDIARHVSDVMKKTKPILPVLVDVGEESLNQSFTRALYKSLVKEGLENITPDTFFTKAIEKIGEWKKEYADTYKQFDNLLAKENLTVRKLEIRLNKAEPEALSIFMKMYPLLTAGSKFEPMIATNARELYQSINEKLCKEYGYGGIHIIFDEFSKYIEGYHGQAFSADMKIMQDICELANKSSMEEQLHITFITHKNVREYEKNINKDKVDAFRGVEGRLKENLFIVSAKNNYELIAHAIHKNETKFKEVQTLNRYAEIVADSYKLPCYESLFLEDDFKKIVGYGCYPLTPVATYMLLRISEKIAQNERTIFTFIAGVQKNSLRVFIENEENQIKNFAGADLVYDYFNKLLMETEHNALIHNEWLKADYALSKVKSKLGKSVIKSLALVQMINQKEQLPASGEVIRLAAGIKKEDFEEIKQMLLDEEIILYRSSMNTYAFKNNVGVDVEKEIKGIMNRDFSNIDLPTKLKDISELDYILPKRYNQIFVMTRYYQYEYMDMEQFLALPNAEELFSNAHNCADGKIIAILRTNDIGKENSPKEERQMLKEKIMKLADPRILVLYPNQKKNYYPLVRRLLAVRKLLLDEQFIEDNVVLEQELRLYEEDLEYEINVMLELDYMVNQNNCTIFHINEKLRKNVRNNKSFNIFLSDILLAYYGKTPKVNNESINRENVSTQIKKARDKIIKRFLAKGSFEEYMTGTAAEATIYRAVMVKTGIVSHEAEEEVQKVFDKIHEFIEKCAEKRQPFIKLYQVLQSEPYGVRRGVIPIFLAYVFSELLDMPVIYTNNKELQLSCETLNNINDNPEQFELFVEITTIQKEHYLEKLEDLFIAKDENLDSEKNRIEHIVEHMKKWYRALPQSVKIADYSSLSEEEYSLQLGKNEYEIIKNFNKNLQKYEVNARDFIFEDIPKIVESNYVGDKEEFNISVCADVIEKVKETMDNLLSKMKEEALGVTKEIFLGDKKDNINNCLKNWYEKQSKKAKSYLHNTQVSSFMTYIEHLNTHDEEQIISKVAKIAIDVYVEDWNPNSFAQYKESISEIRYEVEGIKDTSDSEDDIDQSVIEFTNSQGEKIKKFFAKEDEDSTSFFLKNAIEEAMDEFGDTLEVNQKVSVLVSMLENLLN